MASVKNQDVELGMIGLPHRVRAFGAAAPDQFIFISVRRRTLLRQRHHPRDLSRRQSSGWWNRNRCPPLVERYLVDLFVDGCRGPWAV